MGLVPSNFITENVFRLGLVWAAVSWSIALADRINLMKIQTDITNRKLSNSEHRLAQILEGMPLGVSVYGADLNIQYVNRRRNEIFDIPADGAGRLQRIADWKRSLNQGLRMAGTGEKYPFEKLPVISASKESHHPWTISRRTSAAAAFHWKCGQIRWDEAGKVRSAVLVFQDITERKLAEAEGWQDTTIILRHW
jgi:PAS domain-containing protein